MINAKHRDPQMGRAHKLALRNKMGISAEASAGKLTSSWGFKRGEGRGGETPGERDCPLPQPLLPLLHTPWAMQEARHMRGQTQRK